MVTIYPPVLPLNDSNFTEIIKLILCSFDFQSKSKYFPKYTSPKACSEEQSVFVSKDFYVSFKLISCTKELTDLKGF
jgi:hypothetical protein